MTYTFKDFRKLRSKLPTAKRRFKPNRPKVISLTGARLAHLLLDSLDEIEKQKQILWPPEEWKGESE
jgi:hypothetical protein